MQENLNKFKEQQIQRVQVQQKQLLESKMMDVIVNETKVQEHKEDFSKDIEIVYDIGFTTTFQKCEEQLMMKQKKEFIQTINNISKYSNPMFIQYLGVSFQEQKVQLKKEVDKQQTKKESDKKIQIKKQSKLDSNKLQNSQQNNPNSSGVVEPKIKLEILTEGKLQKFDMSKYKKQIKSKSQFIERLNFGLEIAQAVASLHQLEYSFFPLALEDLITIKQGHLKLAIHGTKLWRMVKEEEIIEIKQKQSGKFKKQNMLNPSLKYSTPQFISKSINIKDVRYNDIWKTGVLLLTILIGEDLTKDVLALYSVDESKIKQHKLLDQAKVAKLKKYLRPQDITQILKIVAISPSQRLPLRNITSILKRVVSELNQFLDDETLLIGKAEYSKEKAVKSFKFLPQLKPNQELLSVDHRKKLTQYFKTIQSRNVKEFILQYRASQTQFSCKSFYQVVFDKKNILVVICQKVNNKKIICFSEQVFDLGKCNGVFGGFIKDAKKLSFLFSPQQNEFCKLKNADKAIGVSFAQGPIFGDGDLIISDGGIHNICRFPASYQSFKLKKLIKSERFEISQYDVYQVLF